MTIITKEKVEALLRERGAVGEIVWRDNRQSTFKQVYDYLMQHPSYQVKN